MAQVNYNFEEKHYGKEVYIFFDEFDKKDLSLVGGKGANLGKMTKAGFPIPYGFCVTTEAYKEFISFNKLSEYIIEVIKGASLENINEIGSKIRKTIEEAEMPENISLEIVSSVKKVGVDNFYAVRSSATAEDLAFASFAGQQDTYLNIIGDESLLKAVKKCWASLFTDRAILYRLQNNIEHEKVQMSVVVQKMVMPEPISPLGIDIFINMLPVIKGIKANEKSKLLKSAAGRIYADIAGILKLKKLRTKYSLILANADALMGEALEELIQREEFESWISGEKPNIKPFLKYITPIAAKIVKNIAFSNLDGTVEFMNNYIGQREKKAKEKVFKAKQGIEKYEVGNIYEDLKIILPRLAPGIIAFKLLEKLEFKLLGTNHYINAIVKGLEGNITTEMGLLTGDLADMVRQSESLISELKNDDYKTLISRINNLNGHDEFKEKFNSFINKYGVRAPGEIDIARDRWIEDPEPLTKSILAIANTSKKGIHREEYKETVRKAKIAAEDMIKEIHAKHGKIKAARTKRLINVLRNSLPIREHHKFLMMRLCMIFKRELLEEARILVEKDNLVEAKDIFYVGFDELYEAILNNKNLEELVKQRKEDYEHYKKLRAPRVITSVGEEIKAGYKDKDIPEGALAGIPVSSGVIEGIAKVITDPSKAVLNKGEILVAPFTDPEWTPLFINAAGLIMEVGGVLTHGTVVAREYGIPAVVGISDATKTIKTG